MITSFEVGAVFKIINEASPQLTKILRQVRELNVALDKARESLATLGKNAIPAGLTTAVAETGDLAKAWGDVAKNAAMAQRAIGTASTAAARAPAAGAAAAAGRSGGGGRHRPGFLGGTMSPDPAPAFPAAVTSGSAAGRWRRRPGRLWRLSGCRDGRCGLPIDIPFRTRAERRQPVAVSKGAAGTRWRRAATACMTSPNPRNKKFECSRAPRAAAWTCCRRCCARRRSSRG